MASNSKKESKKPRSCGQAAIHYPLVGWIAGWEEGRGLLVDFEHNGREPLPARATVVLDMPEIQQAVETRRGAVLLFEQGDPSRPLVVGLLQPGPRTPHIDLILDAQDPVEVEADGERQIIEGREEIVLRCGEAAITLRRDGKIVIQGTHLLSRARWTNRIKGGSVQIN